MCSIMTIYFILDLLRTVYVDQLTGTNKISCGINRTTPCKDLSGGIETPEMNPPIGEA